MDAVDGSWTLWASAGLSVRLLIEGSEAAAYAHFLERLGARLVLEDFAATAFDDWVEAQADDAAHSEGPIAAATRRNLQEMVLASRLARQGREAAEAEDGWGAASASPELLPVAEALPRVLTVAEFGRLPAAERAIEGPRAYAVWVAPGATAAVVGVHCGPVCWWSLAARLQGGAYRTGRDRLRGAVGFEAARALFSAERGRLNLLEPVVFLW